MAKIGDTVRFLNTTGGGRITKIDGRIAYVEENGFETPILLSDIVVVLPAGHEPKTSGASLMFDQKAFDDGKRQVRPAAAPVEEKRPEPEPEPVVETERGEKLNIVLAFEPENIKQLTKTRINAVLVNDSNYYLEFNLMTREGGADWKSVYQGEVAPNELIDLASFTHESIPEMERVVFQCIAFKKGKAYEVKTPVSVSKKIDLTKFYKIHCFRPGIYFDTPVIEIPLYTER